MDRNKKLPVITVAHREEVARLAELPAEATVALQDVAQAIRDGLMALCCSAGLAVVAQLMEAELTDKVGPTGPHNPDEPLLEKARRWARSSSVAAACRSGARVRPSPKAARSPSTPTCCSATGTC